MASRAAPLAAGREAPEERLAADIKAALTRHCGGAVAMKGGLNDELAAVARGYASATSAQALADLAGSVGELVTLAKAHLGAEDPPKRAAARRA